MQKQQSGLLLAMERCTRLGCRKEFDPQNNTTSDCQYHSGGPIFHDGLRSFSCCANTNRPVSSFDEFLAIPGCCTGSHSSEAQFIAPVLSEAEKAGRENKPVPVAAKPTPNVASAPKIAIPPRPSHHFTAASTKDQSANGHAIDQSSPFPVNKQVETDPEGTKPEAGAKCKRSGCAAVYKDSQARHDDECVFHPGSPIFHEGSKGYSCCKPRVLEFDQFLVIQGCSKNRHLFIGPPELAKDVDLVDARIDFYQTPTQVIVSLFAKGADKGKSKIDLSMWDLDYDLLLPASKRACRKVPLFGPIDPAKSTFKILSTKTEIILIKADGRSWPSLEFDALAANGSALPNLTFGVSGRTGSVGSKEMSTKHVVPVQS